MMSLYRSGDITSITPLKVFDVSQLGATVRYFGEGKHMGKVVVTYENQDSTVQVTLHSVSRFRLHKLTIVVPKHQGEAKPEG